MEDRNVCRIYEKTEINTDTYILKPVVYVTDARFDSDNKLIYIDSKNGKQTKKIPYCLDKDFIKSGKKICYGDDIDYNTLVDMYGKTNIEEALVDYVKDCERYNSLVYLDKVSGEYQILKFSNTELLDFADYVFLNELVSQCGDGFHHMFVSDDRVVLNMPLYNSIMKYIEEDNTDAIKQMFTSADKQLRLQMNDGTMGKTYCNMINPNRFKTKDKLIAKTEEEIIEDLNSLVGLDKIKLSIKELQNHLKFVEKSKEILDLDRPNLNMIFTGNPGTGKTTVAKILSALLNKMGLANDKMFECTAKDFIGEYVGHTAVKTHNLIQKAKGGILFIDEAYSFVSQGNSFAQEALAEILKELEKNETIFIFSGYKKEMKQFIKYNSGLASRIGYYFDFENYDVLQLYEMFEKKLSKSKMILSDECKPIILDLIEQATKNENFGNRRFIDKLFSSIIITHANNTVDTEDKEKLITITKEDIKENILEQILYTNIQEKRIGFRN